MPDFERILDQLKIDAAKTPEGKAYLAGVRDGKTMARLQVLVVVAAGLCVLFFLCAFAPSRDQHMVSRQGAKPQSNPHLSPAYNSQNTKESKPSW